MNDRTARRVLALWLAGSAAGAALVALPDDDRRVLSLSETHGPSAVDLAGTLILLAAWLPVPVTLWRQRARVPGRVWRLAALLAVTGAAALVVTIRGDLGWWWVPAALALAAAQALPLAARR
ncbi:MAG TPA: hypothetical protein VNA20_09035 [Frankiaceae bacterium]|nr:hypothetical protein [Frankiaceae bacterium]